MLRTETIRITIADLESTAVASNVSTTEPASTLESLLRLQRIAAFQRFCGVRQPRFSSATHP